MQALAQRAAELSLAAAAAPTCLPPELFWEIALQHLDSQDLLNMALCSRTMHSLLAPQLRAHTFAFAKATPRATVASARLIKHFTHSWAKHDTFPANRATREAYAKSFERAVNVQRVTYMGRTGCVDMWATLCKASESSLREVQIASRSPLVEFHMNKDVSRSYSTRSFIVSRLIRLLSLSCLCSSTTLAHNLPWSSLPSTVDLNAASCSNSILPRFRYTGSMC